MNWKTDIFSKKDKNGYIYADYSEALSKEGLVYFGGKRKPPISNFISDLKSQKSHSVYYGRILCPEHRGESWSYEKNAAFWAGVIDKKRPLKLVTDESNYNSAAVGNQTVDELFWLEDNHYTFITDPINNENTWAIPPSSPCPGNLKKYNRGNGSSYTQSVARERKLASIKLKIQKQKNSYTADTVDNWKLIYDGCRALTAFAFNSKSIEIAASALEGFNKTLTMSNGDKLISYYNMGKIQKHLLDKKDHALINFVKASGEIPSLNAEHGALIFDLGNQLASSHSEEAMICYENAFALAPNQHKNKVVSEAKNLIVPLAQHDDIPFEKIKDSSFASSIGSKLEKSHPEQALLFYKHAAVLDPKNVDYKNKITEIEAINNSGNFSMQAK